MRQLGVLAVGDVLPFKTVLPTNVLATGFHHAVARLVVLLDQLLSENQLLSTLKMNGVAGIQ